jgi:transposase
MRDIQLYQQLLGLSGIWQVTHVDLRLPERQVEVRVECQESVWACPICALRMQIRSYEERRWRHLDSCQFQTILICPVPRVECLTHGSQMVQVPWAEPYGRFTGLFERLAIDMMQECSMSAACEILGISWDAADGIKQRAVRRGLARKQAKPLPRLGVDEKAFGRGHQYVTIVARLDLGQSATVEYVGDDRKRESLDAFWARLTPDQLGSVKAVAMDMWEPFRLSTAAWVPEADIVHDPFHLAGHLNDAVDQVRKQEHRQLLAQGDASLTGTKYIWLYGWENVPQKHQVVFDQLKASQLKTSRAWSLKEMFRGFWACDTVADGKEYFQRWYNWAIRSRLEPVKHVARSFKRHVDNIVTYFDHHLTNAALEGLNSKIQGLIKKACGYRNRERFKTDIMFHCGGLDLYPAQ